MSPNTRKQKSLRRIEVAVGRDMPRVVYSSLSIVSIAILDELAGWLEGSLNACQDKPGRTLGEGVALSLGSQRSPGAPWESGATSPLPGGPGPASGAPGAVSDDPQGLVRALPILTRELAKRLIVEIARRVDMHPEAVSDFLDDITRIDPS